MTTEGLRRWRAESERTSSTTAGHHHRYRIHLKLISQSGANEAALRFQLLTVPGIQDVVFDSEAGTFYCYVYAITPTASASILSAAQNAINNFVAFPLTGAVLNPDLVGISLATTITLTANSTSTDQANAVAQAVAAAQNYINNLTVGQELVINAISNAIFNSSANIIDVGQPDNLICSTSPKNFSIDQVPRCTVGPTLTHGKLRAELKSLYFL